MSSSIFGDSLSAELFGAEESAAAASASYWKSVPRTLPLPPGGYPEEAIPPEEGGPISEPVRALSTGIVSALFAANIPPSMIATAKSGSIAGVVHVVVVGRTLGRIPASVLDLVGIDRNGATAQVIVTPVTERDFVQFTSLGPTRRARYGAAIPGVVFSVGPSGRMIRNPELFIDATSSAY